MPQDFRVYGHLAGLDDIQLQLCTAVLGEYEFNINGDVLDFVHEGGFIDVERDLESLLRIVREDVRGVIDIINHQDWEMHRYTLADGAYTRRQIALDNALDTAYASERRS